MIKSFIREYIYERYKIPNIESSLKRLSRVGFQPNLIFDAGAYIGEFTLLSKKIFPNASIACFEVLDHAVEELNIISNKNNNIRIFNHLLGSEISENIFFNEAETSSSVLKEQIKKDFKVSNRSMKTVDFIVDNYYKGIAPDLLKLDVQGYELEILIGSEKSLSDLTVILAEINILDIHKDVPLIADVIEWLRIRGWVVYDICGITRRPLDDALWQIDLIFVKNKSNFRTDKRWGK